MAKRVVKGAVILINSVDYSAQANNVELALEGPEVDVTNYSSAGWQEFLQGLKSGQLTVEWKKDDAMALDAALWTIFTGATGVTTFEVRVTTGAASASNPKFTGSIVVTSHNPGPGQVGSAYGNSQTFKVTGAVSRAEI